MLSLLILLVWKLKQHFSGTAGAPGETVEAQLNLETATSHLSPPAVGTAALWGATPLHAVHEANPSPQPRGAVPVPQPTGTEREAALTLSQALAAQHGEEEEEDGTEYSGRLCHAGAAGGLLGRAGAELPSAGVRATGLLLWGISGVGFPQGQRLCEQGEDLVPCHVPKHRG